MTQPNGPRAGRSTGRSRNTLVNNLSRLSPYKQGQLSLPGLSPTSAISYGGQAAQLQSTLFQKLANIRAEKGQVRGQFVQDIAAARQARIQGAVAAEAQALQSGMVGSSADLQNRAAVVAQQAQAKTQALAARSSGLLALQQERINAANDYYTQLFQMLAAKRAEQAQAAIDAFRNDETLRQERNTSTPATSRYPDSPYTYSVYGKGPKVTSPFPHF